MRVKPVHVMFALPVVVMASLPLSATDRADERDASKRTWTLMFYMAVDNSAEAELGWFDGYPRFFHPGKDLAAIMLVDRSKGHSRDADVFGEDFTDTRLYHFGKQGFERLDGSLDRLREYWIEGGGTKKVEPRWSVMRNVLGWLP